MIAGYFFKALIFRRLPKLNISRFSTIYRNVSVKRTTSNCLLVSVPCTCIASMAGVVNESSGICSAEEGSPLSTRNCMMGRRPWREVLWARLKWCSLLPYVSTSWLLNMWCYVGGGGPFPVQQNTREKWNPRALWEDRHVFIPDLYDVLIEPSYPHTHTSHTVTTAHTLWELLTHSSQQQLLPYLGLRGRGIMTWLWLWFQM